MKAVLLSLFIFFGLTVSGQSILGKKLDGSEQGKLLSDYFEELEKSDPIKFFYLPDWIANTKIEQDYSGKTLEYFLEDIFRSTNIEFQLVDDYAVILIKDPSQSILRDRLLNTASQERKKIEPIIIGAPSSGRVGKVTLTGRVADEKSKDPLVGASVIIQDLDDGVTTDIDGNFSISLPIGEHILNVRYFNYEDKVYDVQIYEDGNLNVTLSETPTLLEEIVVTDKAFSNVMGNRGGQTTIKLAEIKRMPSFMGQVDLIRQVQTLPGVTSVGEVATGFNVRGGGVDQNLVLYDGINVFNISHVFGFFSAFNSDALKEVSFYRGGIPAEFGGRVSSVLNISVKEGNFEKWEGNGGIGIVASNFTVGGPIIKDKTSAIISLRSSYSDWLLKKVKTNYQDIQNSSVAFYDASLKLSHLFSNDTKLQFTGYVSQDKFGLPTDTVYRWHNRMGVLRLDHNFNEKLGASVTAGVGSYAYTVEDEEPGNAYELGFGVTYPTFKADFNYNFGNHKVNFGGSSVYYRYNPGSIQPSSDESLVAPQQLDKQNTLENAIYISENFQWQERFNIDLGVRYSMNTAFGAANVYVYDPGLPKDVNSIIDTLSFAKGDKVKSYTGLEPRFSVRYSFTPNASVKAGFNRIYQYTHLISNSAAVAPIDIWQPSNYHFQPQYADQVSIGFFKDFKEKTYETFVEFYYKNIYDLLDFKDGAQLILNDHLETDLLRGNGLAYGFELSIIKSKGRFSGTLNYTYSRSFRETKGNTSEESVNDGEQYPSNFDQPHVFNFNWKYNISKRYFISSNFTYHTGRPISAPTTAYLIDNVPVANFSLRNQYRIPDYHRLDLAFIIEGNHKRKKFWDGTWTISVYNVYGRKNPYTIFFADNGKGVLRPYQMAIIGAAIPSVSYTFKF
ncbi:MAG: TonB-dependent receptor [Cyclobacteriaceae bacterium]|nr:TonB-dependent receptor [Cyclobacteriaceae bacterium]